MLSVQPILDISVNVNLVDDLVCVILKSSSENDNFVILSHLFNEINAAWSH